MKVVAPPAAVRRGSGGDQGTVNSRTLAHGTARTPIEPGEKRAQGGRTTGWR